MKLSVKWLRLWAGTVLTLALVGPTPAPASEDPQAIGGTGPFCMAPDGGLEEEVEGTYVLNGQSRTAIDERGNLHYSVHAELTFSGDGEVTGTLYEGAFQIHYTVNITDKGARVAILDFRGTLTPQGVIAPEDYPIYTRLQVTQTPSGVLIERLEGNPEQVEELRLLLPPLCSSTVCVGVGVGV